MNLFQKSVAATAAAFVIAMSEMPTAASCQTPARHIDDITDFVAEQEAFRAVTYDDLQPNIQLKPGMKVKGTLTIGYGTTGPDVQIGNHMTEEEAKADLREKIARLADQIEVLIGRPVPAQHLKAYVSLSYNVGIEDFRQSTTLQRYREGDIDGAAASLVWFVKSNGRVVRGLAARRERERELLQQPD